MDFYAILDQVVVLLQQRQRVTYRALKRQCALDDDALAQDAVASAMTSNGGDGDTWLGDVE